MSREYLMPDPVAHPQAKQASRTAIVVLFVGILLMILKYGVYVMTHSAAVLADTLESSVNIAAALLMVLAVWYGNRPADEEHPYGHGKIESLVVWLEGLMIMGAGVLIIRECVHRMLTPVVLDPQTLGVGALYLSLLSLVNGGLGWWLIVSGKKHENATLVADGKHLLTDVITTVGAVTGMLLVKFTGVGWLDPLAAGILGLAIVFMGGHLLYDAFKALVDHTDPAEIQAVETILNRYVGAGTIRGFHKVRLRHNGPFHWVDLHVLVEPGMTVAQSHAIASEIEGEIERMLTPGNATAHVEPWSERERNDAKPMVLGVKKS
jgi:cation diffusion facilitator family transporter